MIMTKVHTIDLNFQGTKNTVAVFLIEGSDGLILVESGPYSCYESLVTQLGARGFKVEDIKQVLLTHIHFDHAGAAWKLASLGARIYVHPFGAKHLIAPERLVSSAKMIYKDRMETLWGDIKPINEGVVEAVDHLQEFTLSGINFTAYHTPGHARHHICWKTDKMLFAGDVAGVKIGNGPAMPPCPPPDIDIEAWKSSLALIKELAIEALYLTHFGLLPGSVNQHLVDLEEELDLWVMWIKSMWVQGYEQETVLKQFVDFVTDRLLDKGLSKQQIKEYEFANPAFMSVAGLYRYWNKKEG